MTIKELRERLANLPEDYDLLMASDPEGNSYWHISEEFDKMVYFDGGRTEFAFSLRPTHEAEV